MRLLKYPDPWLFHAVKPFDFERLDPLAISEQMIHIMRSRDGLGLSANQVGLDASIFVMRSSYAEEPITVINPTILESSTETVTGMEGCLSYPGVYLDIQRPAAVVLNFLDKYAVSRIIEFRGLDARCVAHEYDHLNGIVYTSLVSRLKYQTALKKGKRYG